MSPLVGLARHLSAGRAMGLRELLAEALLLAGSNMTEHGGQRRALQTAGGNRCDQ